MVTDLKVIGDRLLFLRDKKLDLTQQQVADELNITRNKIHRYENGDGGSLDDFLLLVDLYEKKLHPVTFNILAEDFKLFENRVPAINQVAIERLNDLNLKINGEFAAIAAQLNVIPQF